MPMKGVRRWTYRSVWRSAFNEIHMKHTMQTHELRTGQRSSPWATAACWITLFGSLIFTQTALAWSDDCKQAGGGNLGNGRYQVGQGDTISPMKRSITIHDTTQWMTPGLTAVQDEWTSRVICFSSKERRAIVLKIVPTATYLESLQANGLDLRIASVNEKPSEDVMLLRDRVVAGVGKTVSLQGYTTTPWAGSVNMKVTDSNLADVAPWFVLRMSFVVSGSGSTAGTKRTLSTPDPSGLSIKVMPAGYEAGALVLTPLASSTLAFFQCPAPEIRVNGSTAKDTNIDFGNVSLDRLTGGDTTPFTRSFSVAVVPAPNSSGCSVGNRGPKMRFVAANTYQYGMFEGDVDLSRYPGNSVVGIELLQGSTLVKGSYRGDPSTSTLITLDRTGASQSFTATVKRKQNAEDRAGPFLIPVNLEAYYN